jgi:hypothetical protein
VAAGERRLDERPPEEPRAAQHEDAHVGVITAWTG